MPNTVYNNTVDRSISDLFGDRLSVLSFGAVGDGTTDDSPAINKAIQTAIARGGKDIYFPGGKIYLVNSPIVFPSGANNVRLTGDHNATVIKRGANMPDGTGVFDIQGASNVTLRWFLIEGNVLTPTKIFRGTFNNDPMNVLLTKNTSIWVHGGSKSINIEHVKIQHTGGYAVVLDATSVGDINDVMISHVTLENCRPQWFGGSATDLNYGGWAGGIHYQGDGVNYAVNNLTVRDSTFRRVTGNCVWGHLWAFTKLHTNIRVVDNYALDIGLDFVEFGGVLGGELSGNYARRIGYMTSDDTSSSTPAWDQNGPGAVAYDTSGLCMGVTYKGNTSVSVNGGHIDLDGFADGLVMNNVLRTPRSTDPEYVEDKIGDPGWGAHWLANHYWEYGINTGNTSQNQGGENVSIIGNTIINIGGGAIKLFGSRHGTINDNNIIEPDAPNFPPITVGNLGAADNMRGYDNLINDNRITWSPATPQAVVQEMNNGSAYLATDKNWVFGNKIFGNGNAFEFDKDANTSSSTSLALSSNAAGLASLSGAFMQREGSTGASVVHMYTQEGATVTSDYRFYDYSRPGHRAPLFNVGSGIADGVISTGTRNQSAFDDAVLTSRAYVDGFICVTDSTRQKPNDPAADLLGDTVGLIAYDSVAKQFLQSTAVSAGHRVWGPLGAAVAGADQQVQYNKLGAFAADANFSWDYTNQVLAVTGKVGAPSIHALVGYVQADGGFLTTNVATTAIQAPSGGITGKYLIGTTSITMLGDTAANAGVSGAGTGRIYFDSTSHKFMVSENGSGFVPMLSGAAAGSNTQVQWNNNGIMGASANFTWDNTSQALTLVGIAGTPALKVTAAYVQSDGGFITTDSAANAIQAPNGGYTGKSVTLATSFANANDFPLLITSTAGAGLFGRLMGPINTTTREFGLALNASLNSGATAWQRDNTATPSSLVWMSGNNIPVVLYVAAPGTGNIPWIGALQIYQNGNVGVQGAPFTGAGQALTVTGQTGQPGINLVQGYMISDGGYYSANTSTAAVNLPNGGISAVNATFAGNAPGSGNASPIHIQCVASASTASKRVDIVYGDWHVGQDLNENGTKDFFFWNPSVGPTFYLGVNGTFVNSVQPHYFNTYTRFQGNSAPAAAAGFGFIYFDSATGKFKVSENGAAFVNLLGGGAAGVSSLNSATGALNIVAGTGVAVSTASPNITISIGQPVGTGNSPTFFDILATDAVQANRTSGAAFYAPNGYAQCAGFACVGLSSSHSIQSGSGISAGTDANGGYYVAFTQVIDVNGTFVGPGILTAGGVGCRGVNPKDAGGVQWFGGDWTVSIPSGFIVNGTTFHNLVFVGGVLVNLT